MYTVKQKKTETSKTGGFKKKLNKKFGVKFPMDIIIVRTSEFVYKRYNDDFFIKKILMMVYLYERTDERVNK